MSYPLQIEAAMWTLHHMRWTEIGPVPNQPGVSFETNLGRPLNTQEQELAKIAIEKIAEFIAQPGFGPAQRAPQPHPMAVMLAQAAAAEAGEGPDEADPPGPTAPAPEPGPKTPGEDGEKPKDEKPAAPPEKEKEPVKA